MELTKKEIEIINALIYACPDGAIFREQIEPFKEDFYKLQEKVENALRGKGEE